jgi:hypothetical protein
MKMIRQTMNHLTNTRVSLGLLILLLVGLSAGLAQSVRLAPSLLGLRQLDRATDSKSSKSGEASKFEVDPLEVLDSPGLQKTKKDKLNTVEFGNGGSFSRPLRAKRDESGYVSIAMLGSVGTVIDVGGAKIGVGESSIISGYANIMVKGESGAWLATPLNVPFRKYEGSRLATLPVLTVRLDPAAGEFDLYANSQLLAAGIPYDYEVRSRKIEFLAGAEGARLMGLVQSDINPLYVDENNNGIDDDFELAHSGALLASNASKGERKALIKDWKKAERFVPPPPLFVARPRPD